MMLKPAEGPEVGLPWENGIADHFMGHYTEKMRRRYQHLFPEEKRKALGQLGY